MLIHDIQMSSITCPPMGSYGCLSEGVNGRPLYMTLGSLRVLKSDANSLFTISVDIYIYMYYIYTRPEPFQSSVVCFMQCITVVVSKQQNETALSSVGWLVWLCSTLQQLINQHHTLVDDLRGVACSTRPPTILLQLRQLTLLLLYAACVTPPNPLPPVLCGLNVICSKDKAQTPSPHPPSPIRCTSLGCGY